MSFLNTYYLILVETERRRKLGKSKCYLKNLDKMLGKEKKHIDISENYSTIVDQIYVS